MILITLLCVLVCVVPTGRQSACWPGVRQQCCGWKEGSVQTSGGENLAFLLSWDVSTGSKGTFLLFLFNCSPFATCCKTIVCTTVFSIQQNPSSLKFKSTVCMSGLRGDVDTEVIEHISLVSLSEWCAPVGAFREEKLLHCPKPLQWL